ncbi:MAG: CidA/LrgA family protein [Clostridiales bacterium]|nr:CidA/LrgA family protein [Clostridiales bacterium]
MKYLTQFLRILAFTLAGELLQRLVPLPIPASVYGLVLLFGALNTGLVKLEQVKDAGGFLISILPILFVSPAVGILDNWEAIRGALIPILALTLLSTVLTFGIAGRATQAMMGKEEKPNDASGEH